VITVVDEPPLAVALADTLEPAVALPASRTRASKRQGATRRNKTFIGTSLHRSIAMIADTPAAKDAARAAAFTIAVSPPAPLIGLEGVRWSGASPAAKFAPRTTL
jgi:hypothetical protein